MTDPGERSTEELRIAFTPRQILVVGAGLVLAVIVLVQGRRWRAR